VAAPTKDETIQWLESLSEPEMRAMRVLLVVECLRSGEYINHVAAFFGMQYGSVAKIAQRAKITVNPQPKFGSEKRLRNEKMAVERLAGRTFADIAKQHGITRQAVQQALKNMKERHDGSV